MINWEAERKNFGVDSDAAIARRLKVSREYVRKLRTNLGIPKAKRKPIRRERTKGDANIVESLYSVPLTAFDCQLLTDARVRSGWSQSELARQIEGCTAAVHNVESGKANPSPDFLSRLCDALGLDWQCKFQILISEKVDGK